MDAWELGCDRGARCGEPCTGPGTASPGAGQLGGREGRRAWLGSRSFRDQGPVGLCPSGAGHRRAGTAELPQGRHTSCGNVPGNPQGGSEGTSGAQIRDVRGPTVLLKAVATCGRGCAWERTGGRSGPGVRRKIFPLAPLGTGGTDRRSGPGRLAKRMVCPVQRSHGGAAYFESCFSKISKSCGKGASTKNSTPLTGWVNRMSRA